MSELTDLDGVGPKTAEGLKSKGYRSKEELIEAYREGRLLNTDVPSRVETAIQKDLLDRGESFTDPRSGIEITPERRGAFEVFDRDTNDSIQWFGSVSRNKPKFQETTLVDLAGFAVKGELEADLNPKQYEEIGYTSYRGRNRKSKKNTRRNQADSAAKRAFEMGIDAAANLTDFSREEIEEGNSLARSLGTGQRWKSRSIETRFTEERELSTGGTYEQNQRVGTRDFVAASRVNRSRSPRSRRVDARKDAPITTDLDVWAANPHRWDYPGVDTPGGQSDFTSDRGRSRADEAIRVFEEASKGARNIALGDLNDRYL